MDSEYGNKIHRLLFSRRASLPRVSRRRQNRGTTDHLSRSDERRLETPSPGNLSRRDKPAAAAVLEALGLDLDPLVPGARIGHGLDDPHVTHARFNIGLRLDPALRFHRRDEIVLAVPPAFALRR